MKVTPPTSYFYLKVKVTPHWGWLLSRFPFSKSRPPLKFPPPTTILGALSYPLNKLMGFPESVNEYSGAELYRGALVYVGLSVDGPVSTYFDLTKIAFFYRKTFRTDAVAFGKTYVLGERPCKLILCYVFAEDALRDLLKEKVREKLILAAHGITRIGSRESTVSVEEVEHGVAEVVEAGETQTKFSFYIDDVIFEEMKGDYEVQDGVVDWRVSRIGDYGEARHTRLIIPYSEGSKKSQPVKIKLSSGSFPIRVRDEFVVARLR